MLKKTSSICSALSLLFFLTATLSFAVSDDVTQPEGFSQDSTVSGGFSEDIQVNYFLLSVSGDGQVVISSAPNKGSVFIRLYAANPEVGSGENIIAYNTEDNISYYALRAGQYKISVIPYGDASSYTMTNSYTPPTFSADMEPNDTAAQASTLLLKGEEFAEVYGHHGYAYDAYGGMPVYNRSDTEDVWKIETEEDGYLIVDSALAETLEFVLYLYDEDDQLMLSYSESDALSNVEHQLAAGTYYIKTDYVTNFGSYMLTASLEPMNIQNDPEPNDETLTATVLPVGGEDTGHIGFATDAKDSITGYYRVYDTDDYWKITTTEDGVLSFATTANVEFDKGPFMHVYVYSADGILMQSNYNYDEKLTVESSIEVEAGTYFIDVKWEEGYGSYVIACDLEPSTLAAETEPNDTMDDAVEITLEEPVTGHLGFITDTRSGLNGPYNVYDSYDYWKISYEQDTVLELTMTAEVDFEDTLSTYIHVYNEYKTFILSEYDSDQGVMKIDPLIHEAGYIYVQIKHVDGFGSYTLSGTFTPPALEGDANQDNPNDLLADATQLPIDGIGTGHLGFTKKYEDRTDYWTFYAAKEETLYVTAISENEYGEGPVLYLSLLKEAKTIANDYNYDYGDTTQIAYYVTPGTYDAAVKSRSGYGSYTLSISYLSDTPQVTILTDSLDIAIDEEEYSMKIEVDYTGDEILSYEIVEGPDWLTISDDGVLGGMPGGDIGNVIIRVYTPGSEDILETMIDVAIKVTGVEDNLPNAFNVSSAYPNPFNASTTIRYEVPVECDVRLEIYDVFGRKIAVLADGRMSPGVYDSVWDSRINSGGKTIGSGVYLYRFTAQGYSQTGKIMLLQ